MNNPYGPRPINRATAAAIAAWNTDQERVRDEYARNPITRGHVLGPCITGCGRPTQNHTGLCRTCTLARNKSQEKR